MSCFCQNKKYATLEKTGKLPKVAARMEGIIYMILKKTDGTYDFKPECDNNYVELIYPY